MIEPLLNPTTLAPSPRLSLFDNVQFLYELNLACLELEAAGITYKLSQDFRHFTTAVKDDGVLAQFRMCSIEIEIELDKNTHNT